MSNESKQYLTKIFDLEEIKIAVWECDGNMCPEPDGFNFKFIKANWHILKDDIGRVMQKFWVNANLPKGCNLYFLGLIPKIEASSGLVDYRPISLMGSLYKILAKVLARRLKGVIGSIIEENQFVFVGGRNMLD